MASGNSSRKTVAARALYQGRIRERLLSELAHGPANLHLLTTSCLGAFPTEIQHVVLGLTKSGEIVRREADVYSLPGDRRRCRSVLNGASAQFAQSATELTTCSLPAPHPANFDWRYTNWTRKYLWKQILRHSNVAESVALVCAPTLALSSEAKHRSTVLFDQNPEIVRRLTACLTGHGQIVEHDLFNCAEGFSNSFSVLMADPPWYLDYYRAVLRRAQELLMPGGTLMLSLLPELTRPSAIDDRGKLARCARLAGFDIQEILPNALVYETPEFERRILDAVNVTWTRPWRRGDLGILKFARPKKRMLAVRRPAWDVRFDSFFVGDREIKVRRRPDRSTMLQISIIRGDKNNTIGTVSRRSRRRFRIDIWTTDNVGYAVQRLPVVKHALVAMTKGMGTEESVRSTHRKYGLNEQEQEALRRLLNQSLVVS